MIKKRLVVDTNLYISATLKPHSYSNKCVRYILSECIPIFSRETAQELYNTLTREKFLRYAPEGKRKMFYFHVMQSSEIVLPDERIDVCRDPKDNMFLEAAVAGNVDYLISGDKDLRALESFRGIPILTAREFMDCLFRVS